MKKEKRKETGNFGSGNFSKKDFKRFREQVKSTKKPESLKQCHAFFRRECVNRDIECHRCSEWY